MTQNASHLRRGTLEQKTFSDGRNKDGAMSKAEDSRVTIYIKISGAGRTDAPGGRRRHERDRLISASVGRPRPTAENDPSNSQNCQLRLCALTYAETCFPFIN